MISPDPNMEVDQVVLPVHMARTMTFPERVNRINLNFMRELVRNGPHTHPGANYVEKKDGHKFFLAFTDTKRTAEELQIGDIVERHVIDDDILLFNR